MVVYTMITHDNNWTSTLQTHSPMVSVENCKPLNFPLNPSPGTPLLVALQAFKPQSPQRWAPRRLCSLRWSALRALPKPEDHQDFESRFYGLGFRV